MNHLPKVLIIGRPNVGKSTLLNKILGRRAAITMDTPGVTRDLSMYPTDWNGLHFLLVDSGGVFFSKTSDIYLQDKIEDSVKRAMKTAEKIVMLADFKDGVHPHDKVIARELRNYTQKTVLAVNKVDDVTKRGEISEFYGLGLGEPLAISSIHGNGLGDLLDAMTEGLDNAEEEWIDETIRVAIVGRPNVGKSSLINAIINENRLLVDNQSGTTRDAIEVYFEHEKHKFMLIDTAGIRRKARVKDDVEYYSVVRSNQSIKTAHLVVMVMDATEFLLDQDKKIIATILEMNRNMIIWVNKWDLTERSNELRSKLHNMATFEFPALDNFPFIFGSALARHQFGKLYTMIPDIVERSKHRISTSEMNQFVEKVVHHHPPVSKSGRRAKVYYMTQTGTMPPRFVYFINHEDLISPEYIRYLERQLRKYYGIFEGVPIVMHFRGKEKQARQKPPAKIDKKDIRYGDT